MSCRRKDYRDLDKFRLMRRKQKQRYRDRTGSCLYLRRSWDVWEDELILEHEMPDVKLSVLLGRSVQSIQTRRSRLRKAEKVNEI